MTTLPPDSELLSLQTNFTQHLRNPDLVPVPDGLDKRRMGIYSSLIFHNISALMQDFFPVVYSLMEQGQWDDLIREFFITYRAETPYFPKLADEFLNFLMNRPGTTHEPDFLIPLAHYEWIELCLFTSEEELATQPLSETELKTRAIKLSDLALPVAYDYPVHQIQSDWEEKQLATCLLVFRDKMDDVRFFEIQPLAFELLSAMQQNGQLMIMPWLEQKAVEFGQAENPDFMRAGFDLVQQFNQEHLFI